MESEEPVAGRKHEMEGFTGTQEHWGALCGESPGLRRWSPISWGEELLLASGAQSAQ